MVTDEDLERDGYKAYEVLACDSCKTCDSNSKEYVSEGLSGTSEKEYPFCKAVELHMIWMKQVLDGRNDCYRYTKDGMS
jgi:hypothetical protein